MKLYQQEIIDGLSEQMRAQSSIVFDCDILSDEAKPVNKSLAFLTSLQNQQQDLYALNSVLVSAGWNKNDDVFSVEELWIAKDTPVDKQFNFMHDDSDIIGHITGAVVVDNDGNHISPESAVDTLPKNIDIVTSAVIYKNWSDPDMRERIANLIAEIEQGKWAVSMEAIFSDFDYALITPDQNNRVLSRSEESAFLTKHLRAYGGTGEYQGYKVGRLLKGFYFSGKGLVAKPANPRSIIFNRDINPFDTQAKVEFKTFLCAMEVDNMPDDKKQVEDLEAMVATIKAEFDAYKVAAEAAKSAATEQFHIHESTLAERETTIATLSAKLSELEAALAAMNKEKEKMMQDYNAMKKGMKNMTRKNKLAKSGVDEKISDEIVAKFEDASDEQFDLVVALMADKPTPEPKPEPKPVPAPEPAPEPDADDELADASQLDNIEKPASASLANPTSEDDQSRVIASSAEWLRKSVLRTTKKLK